MKWSHELQHTGVAFSYISYILVHPNVDESDVISQSSAGTWHMLHTAHMTLSTASSLHTFSLQITGCGVSKIKAKLLIPSTPKQQLCSLEKNKFQALAEMSACQLVLWQTTITTIKRRKILKLNLEGNYWCTCQQFLFTSVINLITVHHKSTTTKNGSKW